MDTFATVQGIIAEQLKRPAEDISPDTRLEDLGDSLDLIEVVYALEVAFKVDIPLRSRDPEQKLDTIADVVAMIDRLVSEKTAA